MEDFVVTFSNGAITLYPQPNITVYQNPDYSSIVADDKGNSYYISPENSEYQYFYYENGDYNSSWLANFEASPIVQTTWSDSDCSYYQNDYSDYSQAREVAEVCNNGSYLFFPSAWTNYTIYYYDYPYYYSSTSGKRKSN